MGTNLHLHILGDDLESAEAAADATIDRMRQLEDILSRYIPESELSRLNTTGRIDDASDALLDVVSLAHRISSLGDGAFDMTIQPVYQLYDHAAVAERGSRGTVGVSDLPPREVIEEALERVDYRKLRVDGRSVSFEQPGMRITPDGIGKGYIVDRGVQVLHERGFPNVLVDAGGDLVAAGSKGDDGPWRIAIRNPRPGLAIHASFDAESQAVATSGDYMQPFTLDYSFHHILDPRTGRSAPELSSSTVIAPDAATADALATLTMVMGPVRGRALLEEMVGCEGYFLSKDLEVTRTSGFPVP